MPGDMDLTASVWGYACLAIFALAYALVVLEERLHLRKSIPALVAASAVWILVAVAFTLQDQARLAEEAFRHNLLDYAELMLFLLAAMTFVNTLGERDVFAALRSQLARRGFSLRRDLLDHGWAGVRHLADRGQSDDGPHPGCGGAGRRPRSAEVCGRRLHQRGRGGQRRRHIQSVRRHHHAHGVAARASSPSAFFRAIRSVARELAGSGDGHVVLDRQRESRSDVRRRRDQEGRPGRRGLAPRFDRAHGRHSQRPRLAAGLRNDDRPRRPEGIRLFPRSAARSRRPGIWEPSSTSSTTWRPSARDPRRPRAIDGRQGLRRVPATRAGEWDT